MTSPASQITLAAPTGGALGTAPDDEFAGASRSQLRQAFDRFTHSYMAMIPLVVLVLTILWAYVGPYLYKWKYTEPDPTALSVHPGHQGHWIGTNESGLDVYSLMMRGTQRDILMILISTSIALFLGVLVGSLAGYFGKFVDNLLMRFVDIMLTVPYLVILILVCARYPHTAGKAWGIAILFGLFGWMGLSRLVRAQFLSLKEREFVEAAHAMGASNSRIILRHLIPNSLGTILVFTTLYAAVSIVAETSLTYLGYGVQAPDTSLGLLVSRGVDAVNTRPWLFYYPGLLILLIVLATNLVGEGVRNAFDPRNNRVRD